MTHVQSDVRSDMQTMLRTQLSIDGASFFLAQNADVSDIKRRVEQAAQTAGTFVDFVVVGNREVSVLVGAGTKVVVSVDSVSFDPRDTGDEGAPFGSLFDF